MNVFYGLILRKLYLFVVAFRWPEKVEQSVPKPDTICRARWGAGSQEHGWAFLHWKHIILMGCFLTWDFFLYSIYILRIGEMCLFLWIMAYNELGFATLESMINQWNHRNHWGKRARSHNIMYSPFSLPNLSARFGACVGKKRPSSWTLRYASWLWWWAMKHSCCDWMAIYLRRQSSPLSLQRWRLHALRKSKPQEIVTPWFSERHFAFIDPTWSI